MDLHDRKFQTVSNTSKGRAGGACKDAHGGANAIEIVITAKRRGKIYLQFTDEPPIGVRGGRGVARLPSTL